MRKRQVIFLDLLFVSIIVILLAFSYLSYIRINNLRVASEWVNHSNEIKLRLNAAMVYVLDAETGQRGYLLTGDPSYEEQYRNALEKADAELSKAAHLTSENQLQQKRILHLRTLFRQRFAALYETLLAYSAHTDYTFHIRSGKVLTDSIRDEIKELTDGEDHLLVNRIKVKDHANALTPVLVLAFSIIAVGLVIIAYIRLRREIHLRLFAQNSEATIRRLQTETMHLATTLERKVEERTDELQKKNISLENINNELLSFNYVASHDLQEPLRKIRAFISRIKDTGEPFSETTSRYFDRIDDAALRMQKLIEALISYSRANNTEDDFETCDLNVIVAQVNEELKDEIELKQASIKSDDLPVLRVIPMQFHQLFTNLLSNALKYSRTDIKPEINITAEVVNNTRDLKKDVYLPHARYWKISIKDNGIGFEKDYEDKIFELFQRLHGKNEFEGTGIGLAICRKIMQNHDSYIFAEGVPNKGATFNIYFPITYYESV